MSPKVDAFLNKTEKWQEELKELRAILLGCGLMEGLKWGVPVYTFQNSNVVGINSLKECCALAFFKGALLSDVNGILTKPGEYTQYGRWVKFISVKQIADTETTLKAYIFEAIEVEKAGLKLTLKTTEDFDVPIEFQHTLDTMPALQFAFNTLTPGRQRGYLLHFSAPKLAKTRQARIEKYIPKILNGKGLNDK